MAKHYGEVQVTNSHGTTFTRRMLLGREEEQVNKILKKITGKNVDVNKVKNFLDKKKADKKKAKEYIAKQKAKLKNEGAPEKWTQGTPGTPDEELAKVNPEYNNHFTKDGWYKSKEAFNRYRENCQRCVPTYEARMRGYDVEAKGTDRNTSYDQLRYDPASVFKGFEEIEMDKMASGQEFKTAIETKMQEWGNGARAEVRVVWNDFSCGHVFAAINDNGNIRFVDPQSNRTDCSHFFDKITLDGGWNWFGRMDDKEFEETLIKQACKKRKER